MKLGSRRVRRGRCIGVLFVLLASQPASVHADIGFPRSGPFEACLDAAFGKWVAAQAELAVNEDPAAQGLDDPVVAAWTGAALENCRKTSGPDDAGSSEMFARHMSRWRQHVFDLAASIRRRGQSD